MKKPQVSIILPCYNSNIEYLKLSIDSVLAQSFYDFELIVIDDASDIDIRSVILQYNDKRIRYYRNQKNLNITSCLNLGLDLSYGKYIARIDDDDIRKDKHKLQKQVNFLENNYSYGLVGTNVQRIDEDGKIIVKNINHHCYDEDIRNKIIWCCQFTHSSVLFRKECTNRIGGYDPNYTFAEDYELWLRIGLRYKFCNLKNSLVFHRINQKGISHKYYNNQIIISYKAALKYFNYYPNGWCYFMLRTLSFPLLYFDGIIKYTKTKFIKRIKDAKAFL